MNNIIRLRFRQELAREWQRTTNRHKLTVALWTLAAGFMLLALIVLTGCTAYAQTNVVVPSVPGVKAEGTSLLLALVPLAVPMIVALAKSVIKFLPSWSLPIIGAGLGELLNFLSGLAGGPSTTALNGVLLGAAGVGTREIYDQLKNKIKPPEA